MLYNTTLNLSKLFFLNLSLPFSKIFSSKRDLRFECTLPNYRQCGSKLAWLTQCWDCVPHHHPICCQEKAFVTLDMHHQKDKKVEQARHKRGLDKDAPKTHQRPHKQNNNRRLSTKRLNKGECLARTNVCFGRGAKGHRSPKCPKSRRDN